MRGLEFSRSRGIDQAHIADDRNNIETRRHSSGTTWDDLANVPFRGDDMRKSLDDFKALLDSLPTDVDDELKQAAAAVEAAEQQSADNTPNELE